MATIGIPEMVYHHWSMYCPQLAQFPSNFGIPKRKNRFAYLSPKELQERAPSLQALQAGFHSSLLCNFFLPASLVILYSFLNRVSTTANQVPHTSCCWCFCNTVSSSACIDTNPSCFLSHIQKTTLLHTWHKLLPTKIVGLKPQSTSAWSSAINSKHSKPSKQQAVNK